MRSASFYTVLENIDLVFRLSSGVNKIGVSVERLGMIFSGS